MTQDKKEEIYFIGLGGAGMSALAELLLDWGYGVSGSDRQESAVLERLRKRGATVYIGHDAAQLSSARLLVYSSAVPGDNPELRAARRAGIPCVKRAQLLGQLMVGHRGIAVAGTHGKTTTTSMIAHVLKSCGLDPTAVVGGTMSDTGRGAISGRGSYFVTEADEYDRSFLTLFPQIGVITNLEADHLDIYKDMDDLIDTFGTFVKHIPLTGKVIYNGEDEHAIRAVRGAYARTLSFGLREGADIHAGHISESDGGSRAHITYRGKFLGMLTMNLPGLHNIKNALATIAVALECGLSFAEISTALETFSGVERRFQFKGKVDDCLFYDDYAHHPTEVRAALEAARRGWSRRIVVLFQPHLYSRTRDFYREFAEALDVADRVLLAPVYPAREKPLPGVSSEMIAARLQKPHVLIADNEAIAETLCRECRRGDLVLAMGAGDIWKYQMEAMALLKENDCAGGGHARN